MVTALPHAQHPAQLSRAVKSARDEQPCGAIPKESVLVRAKHFHCRYASFSIAGTTAHWPPLPLSQQKSFTRFHCFLHNLPSYRLPRLRTKRHRCGQGVPTQYIRVSPPRQERVPSENDHYLSLNTQQNVDSGSEYQARYPSKLQQTAHTLRHALWCIFASSLRDNTGSETEYVIMEFRFLGVGTSKPRKYLVRTRNHREQRNIVLLYRTYS